jgi:NADH-quinone oxidoreductase subunit N
VVGAFYYWRVFKVMYFDEPAAPFDRETGAPMNFIMAGTGVFVLLFIVGAEPLVRLAADASKALLP